MSKRSRRRRVMSQRLGKHGTNNPTTTQASSGMALSTQPQPQHQPSTSPSKLRTTLRSFMKHARGRRMLWIALICLIGSGAYLFNDLQKKSRPGIVEYSSDDPDAQVVLEKDGQEIPLEKGTKYTKQVESGSYKLRLTGDTEGLKLTPSLINMDPGGRAFVKITRVFKKETR